MVRKNDGAAAPSSVMSALSLVGERRKRLDALDDGIGNQIRRVETNFREHLRIELWQLISREEQDENVSSYLHWGKHGDKWQLLVVSGPDDFPEANTTTPLVSCSREMRVDVFERGILEAMIIDAVRQVDQEIEKRERAYQKAECLADDVEMYTRSVASTGSKGAKAATDALTQAAQMAAQAVLK